MAIINTFPTKSTDTLVTQTETTTNAAYEVLFSETADNVSRTETTKKSSSLTYNPSTKALSTGGTVDGYTLAAASAKSVTDNTTSTAPSSSDQNLITGRTLYNAIASDVEVDNLFPEQGSGQPIEPIGPMAYSRITREMIADAYDPTGTFPIEKDEYRTNENSLYKAKEDISQAEPFTTSHWEEVQVGSELNQIKNRAGLSNYAFNGANLKEYFGDADALWAALAQEDYSYIRIGDYWPVTLNGDYWDYGNNTVPIGTTYYSDADCTTEAGTTEAAYITSAINDTTIPGGAKPYCEFKISGVTYYCKLTDTLPYVVRTLSDALMIFEAMPNQYWRYGDSGWFNFVDGRPHILFAARDGLPHTLKMRKGAEIWEGTNIAEFTGDGTTTEFTISGDVGTVGYVFVNGTKKAYNTDYTFDSNKINFKENKQPPNNALLQVEWMAAKTPWTGSAIYRTFNDPDHGIIKLIQDADPKLYAHIYKGPNNKGMRYCGETRMKTGAQYVAWEDRGMLFLPTEDEVWGRVIHSGTHGYAQMQQWPIYQLGGRRHFAKGAGDAASRSDVWCASSAYIYSFTCVSIYGHPYGNLAVAAYAAAPSFIFARLQLD
jgi:hypothetical protein